MVCGWPEECSERDACSHANNSHIVRELLHVLFSILPMKAAFLIYEIGDPSKQREKEKKERIDRQGLFKLALIAWTLIVVSLEKNKH